MAGHAQCPVCTSVAQLVEVQQKLSQASKGAFPAGGQVRHLFDADYVLFALLSAVFVSDYPRLHIGCSNLKSRATSVTLQCYLGRPRTSRSPQLTCRIHPEHCYMLQAEAIRGCNLDQIAAITRLAHAPATGGGVPDASLLLPAGRVHPLCMA